MRFRGGTFQSLAVTVECDGRGADLHLVKWRDLT